MKAIRCLKQLYRVSHTEGSKEQHETVSMTTLKSWSCYNMIEADKNIGVNIGVLTYHVNQLIN